MREKAVLFGPDRRLVGVWTAASPATAAESRAPAEAARAETAPAVIILNSGLVPHSGIWRLHVRLARTLAQQGISSLRFDLSGVGDSGSPRAGLPLDEVVRQDIDAAIAYTRDTQGVSRIVTLGLCSGGRDALDAAGRHAGVVGMVAVDLIADFKTWQFQAVHFGGRLLKLESWKNTIQGRNGRVQSLLGMMAPAGSDSVGDEDAQHTDVGIRTRLTRVELQQSLSPLIARGTRLLFLFSGGLEDNYNHEHQFRSALPELARAPGLSVGFFPEANHTFEDAAHQRALIARVATWCSEGFPAVMG